MAEAKYALVRDGNLVEFKTFEVGEQPVLEAQSKGAWLPVVEIAAPTYDENLEVISEVREIGENEVTKTWSVAALPLDQIKDNLNRTRRGIFADKIRQGYPVGDGRFVQINDGSRANLTGMALTALLAAQNLSPWPEGYSRGWVSEDGTRVELPTPADGMALASAAGAYYANVVQYDQDLENAINATQEGEDWPELSEGWPTA